MESLSLSLGQLQCGSVLPDAASTSNTGLGKEFELSQFEGAALRAARVPNVLYLPDLLLQVVGHFLVPLEAVHDPWSLNFEKDRGFQGKAARYDSHFDMRRVDREVCILANFYSRNFFHFITEELVKVLVLEKSGFDGDYVVSQLPAFASQLLAMMGVSADRILGPVLQPTIYRSAVYTTAITARQLDHYSGVFRALRETLVAASGAAKARASRRLWMDRALGVNNPGRELLNPEQIYPILERHGFEVVDMAEFAVDVQINMAHHAAVLSGPHGAGFIHTMFMPPRSAVIECFSPLFINPGVLEICRLMNHRYFMVAYENCYEGYPYGNRLMVNPSQLELALQSLD